MRCATPLSALLVLTAATVVTACSSTSDGPTGSSAPYAVGLTGGNVQSATVGSPLPLPLGVYVTDQYSAPFAGAVVTFTATGGATTAASTVTTDATGRASTTATLGVIAGTDSITATVAGVTVPVRFTEMATAGPAARDSVTGGDQQSATTGTFLPFSLTVLVLDAHANPVPGDTVTWVAATGIASAATSVTNSQGMASIQFSPALGANVVTALINGTALVATFNETGN